MLCAEDELGIGTSHAGILILDGELQPGELLALADEILEVNVTPNRPDCLGHVGIAREVAALTLARLTLPAAPAIEAAGEPARVDIEDESGCPRYSAVCFEGVRVGSSALPVRARLQSLGVRAISNVVDATNLILLETGQPLHAFDRDKLEGDRIVVRRARPGEKMPTLDGVERALLEEDLVICDAARPVAVAGVMGGATSEVSASTTRILLESAYFAPARVRRTAKRLGLHTEASHRFERGVDPNGVATAAWRCAARFVADAAACPVGPMRDVYPQTIEPVKLTLRAARTRAIVGENLDVAEQARLLSSVALSSAQNGDSLDVTVPTFRPDLTREIDLVEEIARLHGYDRVRPTLPSLRAAPPAMPGDPRRQRMESAREALRAAGLEEVVSYHFVAPSLLTQLSAPAPVRVANPLREEQSAMRTTLAGGLLLALARNLQRGASSVRLFEVGDVFLPRGARPPGDAARTETGVDEPRRVAGLFAGPSDGWLMPGAALDLFDVKGVVSELLSALGAVAEYQAGDAPWLHPGVQARVLVGGRRVGLFGELHPDLSRALELSLRPFLFELELDALGPAAPVRMQELPRFPPVVRDLSFFVGADVPARRIEETLAELRDPLCVAVEVLEDYREAGRVPAGHKGMLWSLTYRAADRTLTDAEVDALHDALRERLKAALSLTLR
jgi:phenylalanyl-tRNA synthetase beta chain